MNNKPVLKIFLKIMVSFLGGLAMVSIVKWRIIVSSKEDYYAVFICSVIIFIISILFSYINLNNKK